MKKLPIVITDGQFEQLQSTDRLTLEEEVIYNRWLIKKLVETLIVNEIEIPTKQLTDLI